MKELSFHAYLRRNVGRSHHTAGKIANFHATHLGFACVSRPWADTKELRRGPPGVVIGDRLGASGPDVELNVKAQCTNM